MGNFIVFHSADEAQPSSSDITTKVVKLRMIAAKAEVDQKRCEKGSAESKKSAQEALKQGDLDAAKMYMATSVGYENMKRQNIRLKSQVASIEMRLSNRCTASEFTELLGEIGELMRCPSIAPDPVRTTERMASFAQGMEDFETAARVTNESLDVMNNSVIPNEQVEEALAKLVDEHNLEINASLPQAFRETLEKRRAEKIERDLPSVPSSTQ